MEVTPKLVGLLGFIPSLLVCFDFWKCCTRKLLLQY